MQSILRSELLRRALLAVGCFALLIFFFSPPWAAFEIWMRIPEVGGMIEVRRATAMLFQMEHIGAKIPDELHGAIQWRLLPPLVGRLSHLPPPYVFGLAHVGCIAVLGYTITVLRRGGLTLWTSAGVTLSFGAASWFFTSGSWLGYFDSWLVLGLLLVAFGDSKWTVWAACACAPWVDERFVIAAPLALFCRQLYRRDRGSTPSVRMFELATVVAVALIALFAVVRLGILARHSGTNATVGGYFDHFAMFDAPLLRILFGVWTGWRVAWFFVLLGIAAQWQSDRRMAVMLAISVATVAIIGLGTAQDLSRSMMLLAPITVLGAVWTLQHFRIERWMPAIVAMSLLLPAHHVMSDRIVPIYYLYHELAAFESPPPAVTAELHELKGILAMQRGEYVAAAEALSLAIKLARNPASASKQRGVLFASQQQWKQARDDFSVMVQHEPKNPDGWFLRAQAELAVGNATAAAADFKQALAVAGPGWAERADVVRFRSKLEPR